MKQQARNILTGRRALDSTTQALCLCLVVVEVSACGEPLVARELVQNNRVIGARVERGDDSAQAWVPPGQAATLRWFVVSPSGAPQLGWAFSLCVAAPVSRDLPICAAPRFANLASLEPTTAEPRLEFTMPNETKLAGAEQITANGAFCDSGNPLVALDERFPANVQCPDPSERPMLATMGVFVARDATTNENPSFLSIEIRFDGLSWPTWTDPSNASSSCAAFDESLLLVQADGSRHTISFALPAALAEALPTVSSHSASVETIQLSHFVTSGDLERAFSAVDFNRPAPQVSVSWSTPRNVPSDGQLVRFYFVLRDGRGGADWSTRAICVTP